MCKSVCVALLIGIVVGCSGDSNNDSAGPQSDTSSKPPLASRLNSMDAAEQRDAAEQQQNASGDERQQQQRNSRTPADQPAITENDVRGEAGGMVSPPTGEMNNGLFPPMPSVAAAGFGGALFPDFQPSSSNDNLAAKDSDGPLLSNDGDPFDLAENEGADSEMDAGPTDDAAETGSVPELTLLPAARRLFDDHAENEAINALYAHHLVSDDSRSKYELNWYPGLKEPRLFFRWGVGVIYNEPRDYSGRHPVIGDPGEETESSDGNQSTTGRRGGLGLGSSGGSVSSSGARTFKNVDTSRPDGFLLYYTGDFGVKLISHLEKRLGDDDPYYGELLKDVLSLESPAAGNGSNLQGNRNRTGADSNASAPGQIGSFSAGDPFAGQANRSGGGNNPPAPVVEKNTSIIERAMGSDTAEKPADDASGSILPGVLLLGVGSKVDLVERAKKANVDSLIVFSVNVAKSRRSARSGTAPTQTSTTSMKIIDLKDEGNKNLFSSKGLKDVEVQEMKDSGKDLVEQEIERAFREIADSEFKASELPSGLNPDNVKKRIGRLLNEKPDNPLPTAVEIISFHEKKLLSEELASAAIKGLFGSEDAEVLVTGTSDQRLEFLKAWLPASLDE